MVGQSIDPDNAMLMRLVPAGPFRRSFHLLGERRDMARVIAAFDVLVVSSLGEGFSNVLGEAMASGVPCVTTDVGDCAWVVGDTGKVVPPRSPLDLADAVTELISLPAPEREQLGSRARDRVVSEFSVARMAADYTSLYRALVDKGRQRA